MIKIPVDIEVAIEEIKPLSLMVMTKKPKRIRRDINLLKRFS
jgi:hypothetical protein